MYNNSIHLPITLIVSHSLLSAAKPQDDIRNNRILTYEGRFYSIELRILRRVDYPPTKKPSQHKY